MLIKLNNTITEGTGPIRILYPGTALGLKDTGIGSIGRIDHARLSPNSFVPMHEHKNDEILSYFRQGTVRHTDSEGFTKYISNTTLMLMKAGVSFFHEEKVLEDGPMEGLQIFIRPWRADLPAKVEFYDMEHEYSSQWRLLAGPEASGALLTLRSSTYIFDVRVNDNEHMVLPDMEQADLTYLLYCFKGKIVVNGTMAIEKGECVLAKKEYVDIRSEGICELVLFVTDERSAYFAGGMYSGNKWSS